MQHIYHVTKAVQTMGYLWLPLTRQDLTQEPWKILTMVSSCALTHWALLHSVYDVKGSQMNMDIRELSGPDKNLLYPVLVYFFQVTQALIWDQRKKTLLYPG